MPTRPLFPLVGGTRDAYVSRVRAAPFLPALILLAACGGGGADAGARESFSGGPDPVIVRIPRAGGVVRAYAFDNPDSLLWRSGQPAPAMDRVLGFDQENGILAFADSAGAPGWIDLRLGSIRRPARGAYTSLASADGWAIYGLTAEGAVVRMTPSGDWALPGKRPVRRMVPTPDGTLLVLEESGESESRILRTRPPDDAILDSLDVPRADRAVVTPVGDRVYLAAGDRLLTVPPNDLTRLERFTVDDDILAMAPTPSGDRVFVATQGSARLERLDRYSGDVKGSVKLPGFATELRMDPLGRWLLARPVDGDSAWVIALGNEELVATLPTAWRSDLPALTPDGRVATLNGADVEFVDPASGDATHTERGGAADLWFFSRWNGFRPRARGIDAPVAFRTGSVDSTAATGVTPSTPATPTPETATSPALPPSEPAPPPPAARDQAAWTLSFAAVLSMERAREIAATIQVDGRRPRVVTGETGGTTVFRVVLGPFTSRDEAERLGRASGHSYWVYEGVP